MTDERDAADRLAAAGEAFVAAWSELPPDLPERLSLTQIRVLAAVEALGSPSLTDLAQEVGLLPSSATRICDRLVAAGHVSRRPDPANRRFHLLSLTGSGEQVLDSISAHRRERLAGVLATLTPTARRDLERGLRAFGRADRSSAAGPAREAVS